jgi:polyhydroxybutyrate depolymerase
LPQPTAAEKQLLITVGDDERGILLLVPTRGAELASRGGRLPLLVLLHGNNQTPWVMKSQADAAVLAEREGVIVALPPGEGNRWRALIDPGQAPTASPDLAYVAGLIEQLAATYPVDLDRVYVAGFSMGAVLSGRIACERADLVAAVALDAGADWGGACTPSRAVSVLVMHGTADTILSIEGVEPFVEEWRELDACPGDPDKTELTDTATVWSSTGCTDGTAVQFIRIEGASHSWFHDPEAMETAWEFFTTYQPSR